MSMTNANNGATWQRAGDSQSARRHRGSGRPPPPLGGEREETTMPGPVFFNTSPACLRQPDERCRPACTNRLPAYMVRLVRLCSRHRLFTELALDTHTRCPCRRAVPHRRSAVQTSRPRRNAMPAPHHRSTSQASLPRGNAMPAALVLLHLHSCIHRLLLIL